ncbi:hypothetical protein [Hydrogenophaga sp. H7]|uniref:hypothetical protein n=1 Tax=Hydrogenophaga sp. H7 TaxID=1882399 RepID=UPI00117AD5DF|nr:hypothetical protein [Hydrogenophaga sp. H7]
MPIMVPTYSEYIQRYVVRHKKGVRPPPGEHHFVAAYLVPKLFEISRRVPDYINPDGTKSIIGDVVYYQDEEHHLGLEVKLGTIRLTKREFNEWIVGGERARWPEVFVGVGKSGIAISSWLEFRVAYIKSVVTKDNDWVPREIGTGYGPQKSVDELMPHLGEECRFKPAPQGQEQEYEARFLAVLRGHIEALILPI